MYEFLEVFVQLGQAVPFLEQRTQEGWEFVVAQQVNLKTNVVLSDKGTAAGTASGWMFILKRLKPEDVNGDDQAKKDQDKITS